MSHGLSIVLDSIRKSTYVSFVLFIGVTLSLPVLFEGFASAAPQLPNREARITTARPGQTFDIVFEFDTTAVAVDVERIEIEFCDAPLGT